MRLEKIDKRMFEYLGHLRFGKVDHNDLTWQQYMQTPSSDWVFPTEMEAYFEKVFVENKDILTNKRVLDVGCEYGNKIPWFDKFKPKQLTCIDPDKECIDIASYAARLVETDTKCEVSMAEDYDLTADTVFILSVNHHLQDQYLVFDKLQCQHLVIDTWTNKVPLQEIEHRLNVKFYLESRHDLKKDRVVLRYRKK